MKNVPKIYDGVGFPLASKVETGTGDTILEKFFPEKMEFFFQTQDVRLVLGDAFELLSCIKLFK